MTSDTHWMRKKELAKFVTVTTCLRTYKSLNRNLHRRRKDLGYHTLMIVVHTLMIVYSSSTVDTRDEGELQKSPWCQCGEEVLRPRCGWVQHDLTSQEQWGGLRSSKNLWEQVRDIQLEPTRIWRRRYTHLYSNFSLANSLFAIRWTKNMLCMSLIQRVLPKSCES